MPAFGESSCDCAEEAWDSKFFSQCIKKIKTKHKNPKPNKKSQISPRLETFRNTKTLNSALQPVA